MYEIEGFSHEEISKNLNIPSSSSRTYLTRAKQKLRELYIKMNKIADGNSR
jgi:DNA-directed RNA polymerase specialized sigma24 family protein